jgi:hypothetical protein
MSHRNPLHDPKGFLKPLGSIKLYPGFVCLLILLSVILTGCLPGNLPSSALPSETPALLSPSPSPTIVWFPATATPTRVQLIYKGSTPTPELLLEHGEMLLSDDFSDATRWKTGVFPDGKISLAANELSLSVSSPRGYINTLLEDFIQDDFYLEITASPTICRGNDEYGVLLRVSSAQDFFRFALMCDGHARLDRILNGQASSSIPPAVSGAIPPGAPSSSVLGIWARGKELRFYANGQYLFDLKNATLLGGGLGLFARAGGEDNMTVNFTNLVLYSLPD